MSANVPTQGNTQSTPFDEYEFKLDDQVGNFLGLNHNLTFFVITAAVGTLGFTLNFLVTNKLLVSSNKLHLSLVVAASITALLSSGSALYALKSDIKSYRLHLRYRHERKSYTQLSDEQKKIWDRINSKAESARKYSLWLLVCTVTLQLFTVIFLFTQRGETSMHHYGEDSTEVKVSESTFDIEFRNKVTGKRITMQIPKVGAKANPSDSPTIQEVRDLASEVAHVLRDKFE
jgi:hypothetical protein